MGIDRDLLERIEERGKRLEAITPEACIATASMLRAAKPQLGSDRQRELAEELAAEFETRAATKTEAAS